MPDDPVKPRIDGIHIMSDVDVSKYQWMGMSRKEFADAEKLESLWAEKRRMDRVQEEAVRAEGQSR